MADEPSAPGVPPGPEVPPPPPVPARPPPPPVYVTASSEWRDLRGLKSALTLLLALCSVISVVAVLAIANRLSVLGDAASGNFGLDLAQRAQDADDFVSTVAIIFLVITLTTAVLFVIWFFRAAKNNEALGRQQPRLGPGWAIGGWFIPLANLVIPVLIAQDLWRGGDASVPRGDPRWRISSRSALVGWWWGLWILSSGARLGAGGSSTDNSKLTLSQVQTSNRIALVGMIISIAAAVLAMLVVRKLTERQEACLKAQQDAWTSQYGGGPSPAS